VQANGTDTPKGALIALHVCELIVIVFLLAPQCVFADTTVINFEGLSDGTILTNQYSGLSFSNGSS